MYPSSFEERQRLPLQVGFAFAKEWLVAATLALNASLKQSESHVTKTPDYANKCLCALSSAFAVPSR